ncbi:Shedu anti-phage system protein SduA domain-containing protein [Pseudomonas inefficax]|nr:Shedu anti-phage system protein SduA domain-containing protein [Pseudomonas inefficax]MEE1908394.1 Shedu anti-phage system protein SduA domain-containing protein [Pseudomonas inefficax]MEE1986133.1 Shedu anti-phage system protein SduA domain-containing protein [Pseudomonas inefficax]
MPITTEKVAKFIFCYTRKYRDAYAKAISPHPEGPGYPRIVRSAYLEAKKLDIYIALNGVAICSEEEPPHQWYIAGGPAIKVDYEPSRTPKAVMDFLKESHLLGQHLGIYKIVSKYPLASCIWRGRIQNITKTNTIADQELNLTLCLNQVNSSLESVVKILTFGAFGSILDTHIGDSTIDFGESQLHKNMGFFPADLNNRRFFTHLEIISHADEAAWDTRLVTLRVQQDLRRDIATALAAVGRAKPGGTSSFGGEPKWLEQYNNRLDTLKTAITDLSEALKFQADDIEAVFHQILEKHPVLLDVYGICESKPEFSYPNGQTSPIGKIKLQPDFIIRYPDQSYKLIEIERPSKQITTTQGQPRAEVGQAVFQTAEWKHYIKSHYPLISSRYPGIQSKCKTSVIMSRFTQQHFKSATDARAYMGLMMEQFNIDEFLTFDDLLERAVTAYAMLSGLSPDSAG